MATPTKRRRVSCAETETQSRRYDENEDVIFFNFPDKLRRRMARCLGELCCGGDFTFSPLQFLNCNAADETRGIPFSKAYCSVRCIRKKRKNFGSVFIKGLNMLSEYLEKGTIPQNEREKFVLCKLLKYLTLTVKDTQAAFQDLEKLRETHQIVMMTNHLFGKLATTPKYIINKNYSGKLEKCPCIASCQLTGDFGDTSIGNEDVWHGDLDVIVNNDVIISSSEEDTEFSGDKSTVEVELRSPTALLKRNPKTIAQSVVFSFLQKQFYPLSEHFMFPCIRIIRSGLVFYFYDSQHDVLLESTHIPLLTGTPSLEDPTKLNLVAILASWFIVNYKYLSSGLPKSLKLNGKADFFMHASAKLETYKSYLKRGNVGVSVCDYESDSDVDYDSDADFFTEMQIKLLKFARKADATRENRREDVS